MTNAMHWIPCKRINTNNNIYMMKIHYGGLHLMMDNREVRYESYDEIS